MVCLGNICRSPLAEGILKHKASQSGVSIEVDSAGTAAYHEGEPPDIRSILIARKHGIAISQLRGRAFTPADFDEFDQIYAMDGKNLQQLKAMARTTREEQKVSLILDVLHPGEAREVPDPYYGGDEGFEQVYQMLEAACEQIVEKLRHG